MTPLEQVITERIRTLWEARYAWRRNRWADYPPERNAQYQELRTLVRLMRKARDISRGTPEPTTLHLQWPSDIRPRSAWAEQGDPVTAAKAEWDRWTEPEKREAFGR